MKGFDPKFKDFPDYILGITKEIWEDRKLPLCIIIMQKILWSGHLHQLSSAIRV